MAGRQKRVMICDDKAIAVRPLADYLESKGIGVNITTKPQNCLDLVRREHFDLFVLDMELGAKADAGLRKGLDLARRLWEENLVPIHVPIVGITGFGEDWKKRALAVGMVDFFKKPLDPGEVGPVLLELLRSGAKVSQANEGWLDKIRGERWHILDLGVSKHGSISLRSSLVTGKDTLQLDGVDYRLALELLNRGKVDETLFEELGRKLYHGIFRSEINVGFHQHRLLSEIAERPTRLLLQLADSGLEDLPWELCRYSSSSDTGHWLGGDPWVTCARMAPNSSRFLDDDEVLPEKLKILVVGAKPKDLPDLKLEDELKEIEVAFKEIADRVEWKRLGPEELRPDGNASPEEINKQIAQFEPHIIHFICHGNAKQLALMREGKVFERDSDMTALSAYFLSLRLVGSGVKLVVFNSCLSGYPAAGSPGMALGSVSAGVKAVIGHFFPVSDEAAIRFTGDFYSALVRGDAIDSAFQKARRLVWSWELQQKRLFLPVLFVRDCFLKL